MIFFTVFIIDRGKKFDQYHFRNFTFFRIKKKSHILTQLKKKKERKNSPFKKKIHLLKRKFSHFSELKKMTYPNAISK